LILRRNKEATMESRLTPTTAGSLETARPPGPAEPPIQVTLSDAQMSRVKRAERLLRLEAVELLTGLKKSSLYALAKDEPLLRPVRITARAVAWPESRVHAFIAKVIAQSDAADAPGISK
jgi:prophage regulatory protein